MVLCRRHPLRYSALATAAPRARAPAKEQRKNGRRFPKDIPSSAMYLILDAITRVT